LQVDRIFFVPDTLFSSVSYTKATTQEQLLPRSYATDFFLTFFFSKKLSLQLGGYALWNGVLTHILFFSAVQYTKSKQSKKRKGRRKIVVDMSDDKYQFNELRKEIDYLTEDVEKLKRLVKSMKVVNRLSLTADDEEYLRTIE
jgi:hypothetical protein